MSWVFLLLLLFYRSFHYFSGNSWQIQRHLNPIYLNLRYLSKLIPSTDISMSSSPKIKELRIPVPWGHISGKQWGPDDGMPVLGVHGWQDNCGTFDQMAPMLPTDWRFVAIDLAGHGHSSHLPLGVHYHWTDYLSHIRRVVEYLGWKKFSYIGHSMGGGLGIVYAAIFPESVDKLVSLDLIKLISRTPEYYSDRINIAITQLMAYENQDIRNAPSYPLDVAIERLVSQVNNSLTKESAAILLKRGSRPAEDGSGKVVFTRDRRIQISADGGYTVDHQLVLIQKLKCSMLILKARDGPYYESKELCDSFLELYKKYCPYFDFLVVDGTHHFHLNTPENVVPHIIKFFNKDITLQ